MLSSTKTPVSFIPTLVKVFTKVEKNAQSRIEQVAEIISELQDPEYHSAPETPLQPFRQDEEVIRAKQLRIAKLEVEMNLLNKQFDEAVTDHNFLVAQQIKAQLDQLEVDQSMLEDQLSAGATPAVRASEVDLIDCCPEKVLDNPTVTLQCLRMLVATLQDPSITQLNATLHILLEEFVTVCVQSELPAIRKEAITALTCCCLRSIQNAKQHMLLLLRAAHIDIHEVRIAAIIAVVDLLMKHGLTSFITHEEPSMIVSALAILTNILDEPELELRTEVAEGFCKLLMIGSINSPKLLSRLLLIW